MFKRTLLIVLLFCSFSIFSQNADATYYYTEGVKAFKENKFQEAESFYTSALEKQINVNTYFNRAMARHKLNNQRGYKEDLAHAAEMGDKEAYTLLGKEYEKADTLRTRMKIINSDSTELAFYHVTYSTSKSKEVMEAKFNAPGQTLNIIFYTPASIIDTAGEENAEFPGGLRALMDHVKRQLKYPSYARERGIMGKVFLKFIIDGDGLIERVEVLKGIEDCKECDAEALRVVAAMPRWKPAKLKGRPVKCYFNLPIAFKVNR